MKSLQEHLNESLVTEAVKIEFYNLGSDEKGDEVLTICDVNWDPLEFEEKWMDDLIKKYHGWYNERFAKAVFRAMPKADHISVGYSRNNDEDEPSCYFFRDEIDKGWQDA